VDSPKVSSVQKSIEQVKNDSISTHHFDLLLIETGRDVEALFVVSRPLGINHNTSRDL
jgi:hypothetical protein